MIRLAALASAVLAAGMPAVLTPLGLTTPAPLPPTFQISVKLAGPSDGARAREFAVTQSASRYGGAIAPAEPRAEGPKIVRIVFPATSLQAQRAVLEQVLSDLSNAGAVSAREESVTPTLDERKAAVAAEAAALAAERAALGALLDAAPQTKSLIDSRLASLNAFDAQREPRRAVLLVEMAPEAKP
ncbi:MAG: hypothetical protein HY925_03295 [Elusimicrobia bacterium]|nr:hypothetical protein [Elusimicrobiota bacterium]